MSIQLPIVAFLDDTQVKQQQSELETKNDNISKVLTENEKRTKESFNEVLGMMRASYMMVSGISAVIGGDMGQMISSIYGVAVAGIAAYQAIAAAMAASGVGTVQAILMTSALISALFSLGAVMTGQTELAKKVGGINMALQGLGGMINSFSIG